MNQSNSFIAGALLGAGIMYLLDPDGGRRRRALVRDQAARGKAVLADAAEMLEDRTEHLRNRAQGVAHETKARLTEDAVDDATLEARVRSAMGRATSTPGAIHVTAYQGRVTLTGQVLGSEVQELVQTIRGVRGVQRVDNFLETHQKTEGISSLQGARNR
jgi:osmotically-inducible protein OsmY